MAFSIDDAQFQLDNFFNCLNDKWVAPILMPMHHGLLPHAASSTEQIDIVEFMSNKKRSYVYSDAAYFDRNAYPPPSTPYNPTIMAERYSLLLKDVVSQARDGGFELVGHGRVTKKCLSTCSNSTNSGRPLDGWVVECKRKICYKTKASQDGDTEPIYRESSLHYDSLNSRGVKGLSMAKRTNTNRAMSKENACPFSFRIYCDEYSFFVKRTGKCLSHCGHLQRMSEDIPV